MPIPVVILLVIIASAIVGKVVMTRRSSRPATDDSRETLWERTKRLWRTYWSTNDAKVLPIVVFVIMIDYCLWVLYPITVWDPIWQSWQRVLILHAFYCVALTGLHLNVVWKARTAVILITICVITLLTNVLGFTPWFGEKYWLVDRPVQIADQKAKMEVRAKEKFEANLLPLDPNGEVVVAPVGKKSERIPFADGPRLDPDGKIFLWNDKNQRVPYNKGDKLTLPPTEWVKIQSGTGEEVKVIISR